LTLAVTVFVTSELADVLTRDVVPELSVT